MPESSSLLWPSSGGPRRRQLVCLQQAGWFPLPSPPRGSEERGAAPAADGIPAPSLSSKELKEWITVKWAEPEFTERHKRFNFTVQNHRFHFPAKAPALLRLHRSGTASAAR